MPLKVLSRPVALGDGALGNACVLRAPGELHHARSLAFCLCIMKLIMLYNGTLLGLLTPNILANLEETANGLNCSFSWIVVSSSQNCCNFTTIGI